MPAWTLTVAACEHSRMTDEGPEQTPEGRLIKGAAERSGRSVRTLAAEAGISDTRWRHIVNGWQPAPGGTRQPVRAPVPPLARMAHVLGLSAEDLERVGRSDAVPELRRIQSLPAAPEALVSTGGSPQGIKSLRRIYESSMSAADKLAAIGMVLDLMEKADREGLRS